MAATTTTESAPSTLYRVIADRQQVWTYPTRGEAEAQRERVWKRYPEMRVVIQQTLTTRSPNTTN